MKKQGFISMTLIYSFLILFLFIILSILTAYSQRNKFLDTIKDTIYTEVKVKADNTCTYNPGSQAGCAVNPFDIGTLKYRMLEDNCAYPDNVKSDYVTGENGIDFKAISSATNGLGLYYTTDLTKTEDLNVDGTGERVYYYRGNVKNNFVKLEETCWKIIRTNEDGSIKLWYSGITDDAGKCQERPNYYIDETYNGIAMPMDASQGAEKYGGYVYGDENISSNAKNVLENWYMVHIETFGNKVTSLIADAPYCNDMKVASTSGSTTNYNTYLRLFTNKTPQYKCSLASDNYTVNSSFGNKKLSKPVALITADEVVYAGGSTTEYNAELYLNNQTSYYTMSPVTSTSTVANIAFVEDGKILYQSSNRLMNLVPVISLVPEVKILSGNGTLEQPYIINTD